MKKTLCAALALLLLLLAACSAPVDGEGQAGGPQEATQASIQQTVLVEESGVKITANEISYDELFGPELKLLIENNTDKNLTVQCRNTSVNGYMIENMMSVDVAAGKKANDSLTFMSSDLEACGIETFADMEFAFHIFTTEDWEDYLNTDQIQLKTSAAETYEYTYNEEGTVLYEGNGVKIVAKGLSTSDSIFGPGAVIYIHNASDKMITVQTRDSAVNGFMIDTLLSEDVMPGKHAVATITFMESDLEENSITQIEEAEGSFHIFDSETWDTIVDTEIVSFF